VLIVSQDGSSKKIEELIRELEGFARVLHIHHSKPFMSFPSIFVSNEYGTSANVKFLLSFAFDYLHSPAAIVLESDLLPSADFYDYFSWAFDHFFFKKDPLFEGKVMAVSSFNIESSRNSDPYLVWLSRFEVWGWGTTRDMWRTVIREGWTSFQGWDGAVQRQRINKGLYVVSPLLSRVKNVGMIGENFRVTDREKIAMWDKVHISDVPLSYSTTPVVLGTVENISVF